MGYYIRLVGQIEKDAKEKWLEKNGQPCVKIPTWEEIPADSCVVCLIDNINFTSACIVYSPEELKDVKADYLGGNRRTRWFTVPKEEVVKVSDITMEVFK